MYILGPILFKLISSKLLKFKSCDFSRFSLIFAYFLENLIIKIQIYK